MRKNKMMKTKIFFTVQIFFLSVSLMAQVGVNTESPQGVFHIDAARNTNGNTNISDDVVVDTLGRVGVGTNAPQTKVDIRSSAQGQGFSLRDGSQAIGRVLTAMDNTGRAEWQDVGTTVAAPRAIFANDGLTFTTTGGVSYDTGCRLSLPPGRWFVMVAVHAMPNNMYTRPTNADLPYAHVWVRTHFRAAVAAEAPYIIYPTNTSLVSGRVYPFGASMITGFLIIDNIHTAPVTVALYASAASFAAPDRMFPLVIARAQNLENAIAAFALTN
ncbi:hypothetical protein [Dysgonomonas sp. 520]|uniref:hypothetical protein n=1 Tax=Dysgonomonas sp. 520 TaxID=2302931 RepID=UPI0013D7A505|nr:hypothetical protein [Dysgonomonas sp. 520]NDW09532.1 hypothetical protein [Dysgonomonas sp. 520]